MHRVQRSKSKPAFIFTLFLIILCCVNTTPALADDGPHRTKAIQVDYPEHYWWLVRESDNLVECELAVDHKDIPTPAEIYQQCELEIYEAWANEAICEQENPEQASSCSGLYFQHVGEVLQSKVIDVELPPATIHLVPPKCSSLNDQFCEAIPRLKFITEEPLPNEWITQVQGTLNNIPFYCEGNSCEIQLRETGSHGISLEFWADSSFGDSSVHHSGQIRVIRREESSSGDNSGWVVDFLISNDESSSSPGCSQIWLSFPPPGEPPTWLANPDQAELLETDAPLYFLAGKLIQQGYVKADQCEYKGLTADGYATQCGLELARNEVYYWQNIYNPFIVEVAQESGIPAQLIKRIINQESQFWPGVVEHTYLEHGLGQLTINGVDATLMWNEDFFEEFCPLVLLESACERGYPHLGKLEQELLRNVFLNNMAIDLPSKPDGFDQEQIQTSLAYLSEVITGNCRQVDRMIENLTGESPGQISSYEDLWRFTLANYHAGPGCLSEALNEVHSRNKPLTWELVSMELEEICPYAIDYVLQVTK